MINDIKFEDYVDPDWRERNASLPAFTNDDARSAGHFLSVMGGGMATLTVIFTILVVLQVLGYNLTLQG